MQGDRIEGRHDRERQKRRRGILDQYGVVVVITHEHRFTAELDVAQVEVDGIGECRQIQVALVGERVVVLLERDDSARPLGL